MYCDHIIETIKRVGPNIYVMTTLFRNIPLSNAKQTFRFKFLIESVTS